MVDGSTLDSGRYGFVPLAKQKNMSQSRVIFHQTVGNECTSITDKELNSRNAFLFKLRLWEHR
jgi:hypothetical protein